MKIFGLLKFAVWFITVVLLIPLEIVVAYKSLTPFSLKFFFSYTKNHFQWYCYKIRQQQTEENLY